MPSGYHAFFSDSFKLTTLATAATGVDMRGWDGVAFMLADGTTVATVQMADDSAFSVNLVTPVIEVDHGQPIVSPLAGPVPYWLEAWRPTKRWVRANGATGAVLAFQYRQTGNIPPTPAPNRTGGRVS